LVKVNGWAITGRLSREMSGRDAFARLTSRYGERNSEAYAILGTAWRKGICARQAPAGKTGFYAVYGRGHSRPVFVIEDGTAEEIRDASSRTVARAAPIRYSSRIARHGINAPQKKEIPMATRTAKAPAAKRTKAAPAPEPEELDEEELEEELDDELDEDEEELDEDEESEDSDEDEDEEDDDEDGDDEDEEDGEEEAVDYTSYASKDITPTMQDFHDWLSQEVGDLSEMDTVRIVALAGTLRMEFQRSEFNKSQRAARQAEAAKAKAAKARAAKPAAAPKVVAKAKVTAAPAKPVRTAKAVPAKAAAAPAKTTRTAGKPARKKGPAPY
jgi:hypothetical protein